MSTVTQEQLDLEQHRECAEPALAWDDSFLIPKSEFCDRCRDGKADPCPQCKQMIERHRAARLLRAAAAVRLHKSKYTVQEAVKEVLEFAIRVGCGPHFDRVHGCGQCISCLAHFAYGELYGLDAAEQLDKQAMQG